MSTCRDDKLYVIGIEEQRLAPNVKRLSFHTTRGDFDAIAHLRQGMRLGAIMLSGFTGGFDGPSSVYPELSEGLLSAGIASLRLDYRVPGDCVQCGIDTLLALQYLDDETVRDVVLVGWSFGGAVALAAGSVAKNVRGITAVSTVEVADCCARRLRSKPVLLIHGEADIDSPVEWPERIHTQAGGPSRLIVYPGAGHELAEAKERLREDLVSWVLSTLKNKQVAA